MVFYVERALVWPSKELAENNLIFNDKVVRVWTEFEIINFRDQLLRAYLDEKDVTKQGFLICQIRILNELLKL